MNGKTMKAVEEMQRPEEAGRAAMRKAVAEIVSDVELKARLLGDIAAIAPQQVPVTLKAWEARPWKE